jgi:hypothetical protein
MKIFRYALNIYVYYIQGLICMNLITWMSQPSPDSEVEDDYRSDLGSS